MPITRRLTLSDRTARRSVAVNARFALAVLVGALLPIDAARAADVPTHQDKQANQDKPLTAAHLDLFEKKVRPILVKHCYECHAKDKKTKGGLNLDTKAGWQVGGDSGPAIEPGQPDKSILITAVRYKDEFVAMPPKRKLSPKEIAVLELWVAEGAPDPRTGEDAGVTKDDGYNDVKASRGRWPFNTPNASKAPAVKNAGWSTSEIDRFVLAKLEAAGLKPAPDADKHTLVRRVYFDLIGLPPTPKQVEAFVNDASPNALEKLVDQLLASPRFGEHWARKWMDIARYADTNGGDFNATYYNAWRYRDYIIHAFNKDKPFDQFVREQVAGDLLTLEDYEAAAEAMVATGFLMVGPKMLSERDKEKLQMDIVDEQVDTIGKTFFGLSLGCARCHAHKFDPVTQEDYYALAGILASTEVLDGEQQQYVSDWVRRDLPVPGEHRAAVEAYEASEKKLAGEIKAVKKKLDALKKKIGGQAVKHIGIVVDDEQATKVGEWKHSTYSPNYVGKGYIHDNRMDLGKKSVTYTPDLPAAGEYEVRIAYPGSGGRSTRVPVTVKHADGEKTIKVNQTKKAPIQGLFLSLGRFTFAKGKAGSVTFSNKGTTDGYVTVDAVQFIPVKLLTDDMKKIVNRKQGKKPTADHMTASATQMELVQLERELESLKKDRPASIPLAIAVRESPKPGDTRLRVRGEVHNRGKVIERGFLSVMTEAGAERPKGLKGSGRLELATWMTDAQSPAAGLMARVTVNRLWHHLMGQGIVRTVDNFGTLADKPSHPALLDTLAADFMNKGWSVKGTIRRIVLSRIYRASSRHDEHAFMKDPDNRLLWKANRRRLAAEEIRDGLLAVSGQLDLTPSREPVKTFKKLAVDNGSGNWTGKIDASFARKRSVYQPIVRNGIPDILQVFDFADPDMVTGRRSVTTVPAQALLLMNSPVVTDAARKTAARLGEGDGVIDEAFALVLGRKPTYGERGRIASYIEEESARLAEENRLAEGVPGDSQRLAVLAKVVQALMASTEFRMLD